jgi:putative oligomerization/nucleic acid binding protein
MMMRRRGGLVRGVARTAVVAGTASAVSGRVQRRQHERWANEDAQAQAEQYYEAAPQAAAPPADDSMDQLQRLADLHAQGILTDEEFAAKKAQILGI